MISHAANFLTILRILFIPILIFSFYVDTPTWRIIAAGIFILGCITDYLDGYVARTFSQISRLGSVLDPVADKLLVASTLLLLAGFDRISHFSLIPAIVILSREILVSGLREQLSELNVTISVSRLAKWKTACQMLSITLLLVGGAVDFFSPFRAAGEFILWGAALLTIITGFRYVQSSLRYF
jgi:cardiolipin synthase